MGQITTTYLAHVDQHNIAAVNPLCQWRSCRFFVRDAPCNCLSIRARPATPVSLFSVVGILVRRIIRVPRSLSREVRPIYDRRILSVSWST